MTENIENRADDSLDPVHGTLRDGLGDDLGAGQQTDDGVPVGEADVDADRARTGADRDDSGAGVTSLFPHGDRE